MAFILEDEFNASGTEGFTLPIVFGPNTFTRRAQVFTPGNSYTLARVGMRLRANAYPKSFTLAIFSTSAGVPNSLLVSEAITITGDDWSYVVLDPTLGVTGGTQYAIATYAPVSGTTTAIHDTSVPGYSGGSNYLYVTPAGTWSLANTNLDMFFRTYREVASAPKPITPNPSDSGTGVVLLPTLSWVAG